MSAKNKKKMLPHEKKRVVTLTMPPELVRFLDRLRWDLLLKSGCGRKLSRTDILRGLVTAFLEGKFDVQDIASQKKFVKTILSQIRERKSKPGNETR
jgi:hypothetical protein